MSDTYQVIERKEQDGASFLMLEWRNFLVSEEYEKNIKLPKNWDSFGAKRRAEYLASRTIYKDQLRKIFDISTDGLLNDENRRPIWPSEIKGSLSHSRGFFFLGLSRAPEVRGLGVDVEHRSSLKKILKLKNKITNEEELMLFGGSKFSEEERVLILFSCKESFYKAFGQSYQKYFGFHDVDIKVIDEEKLTVHFPKEDKYLDIFYKMDEENIWSWGVDKS